MKPVVFALLSMVGYAVSNVLLEAKFSNYKSLTLVAVYTATISLSTFLVRWFVGVGDPAYQFPTGSAFGLLIVLGLVLAVSDYFMVGAYTNGGNLLTITSITVMFPVFASVLKFGLTRSMPNIWQASGYVLAALAVILVTKGSTVK